jgi:hypothetical protein
MNGQLDLVKLPLTVPDLDRLIALVKAALSD